MKEHPKCIKKKMITVPKHHFSSFGPNPFSAILFKEIFGENNQGSGPLGILWSDADRKHRHFG